MPPNYHPYTSGGTISENHQSSDPTELSSEREFDDIQSEATTNARLTSEALVTSDSAVVEEDWQDREVTPRAQETKQNDRDGHGSVADINFDSYNKEVDTEATDVHTETEVEEIEEDPQTDAEETEAMDEDDFDDQYAEDEAHSTDIGDRDESSATCLDDEEEPQVKSAATRLEIEQFNRTFQNIASRYRLIDKIGEGTFSTVYKAEDVQYDQYENEWESMLPHDADDMKKAKKRREPKYVAIKKIYVTSSPARILNELELLHHLTGLPNIVPLITAFRHQDQVVAVLPYFRHVDFRDVFRSMTLADSKIYLRSLLVALESVHNHHIIHRDIKPTNFLYDPERKQGVLCDFGLAELESLDNGYCPCNITGEDVKFPFQASTTLSTGYHKNDQRMPRRANRAGTRGFRAPEVLFKCPNQTTKIDMWSVGVILLTILTKRFPFFNSADDVDALIEIATITGKQRMRNCAAIHGCSFETNIPTVGEKGFSWEKIVLWATSRTGIKNPQTGRTEDATLSHDEQLAIYLMDRLFDLDPLTRITATEALNHEFLKEKDDLDDYDM